jgi:hypothetical protein
MADSPSSRTAPYAPPATVLAVIHHFRQRELPETLSDERLMQIGVKESVLRTVKQALLFLNLIREDGTTTPNFRSLRFAADEDYLRLFREIVTSAYSDIFAVQDPATAPRGQLLNAFRPYSPASQHDRMITLFLALCQEGGMSIAQPTRQTPAPRPNRTTAPRTPAPSRQQALPRSDREGQRTNNPPTGLLFGVTDTDIANLAEDEFDEVWAALGKVARARAKGIGKASEAPPEEGG